MKTEHSLPLVNIGANTDEAVAISRMSQACKSENPSDFVQGDDFFERMTQMAASRGGEAVKGKHRNPVGPEVRAPMEAAATAWLNSPFTRTHAQLAKDREVIGRHVKWLAENPLREDKNGGAVACDKSRELKAVMEFMDSPIELTPDQQARDKAIIDSHVRWLAEQGLDRLL